MTHITRITIDFHRSPDKVCFFTNASYQKAVEQMQKIDDGKHECSWAVDRIPIHKLKHIVIEAQQLFAGSNK